MAITFVLADEHPLFLTGLEQAFRSEDDFEIAASCSSGLEAIEAVRMHRPHIVMMAMSLKDISGLQAARQIRQEGFKTRIALISDRFTEDETIEALRIGVSGILLKTMAHPLILQGLRKVYSGEQWVDHGAAMQAVSRLMRRETGAQALGKALTRREVEVATMVSQGLLNKEIADSLCLSEGTVKVHLHSIYEKLNVRNRIGLMLHVREQGLAGTLRNAATFDPNGACQRYDGSECADLKNFFPEKVVGG